MAVCIFSWKGGEGVGAGPQRCGSGSRRWWLVAPTWASPEPNVNLSKCQQRKLTLQASIHFGSWLVTGCPHLSFTWAKCQLQQMSTARVGIGAFVHDCRSVGGSEVISSKNLSTRQHSLSDLTWSLSTRVQVVPFSTRLKARWYKTCHSVTRQSL